jgi:bifunctional UDP-N-acetylglucosamine pyrophosphorylase/glucosamine-1-phosphate N-acetyltransferase
LASREHQQLCVIVESRIADGAAMGRSLTAAGVGRGGGRQDRGNFVELKKTTLGARSKVNHLSYVGDAPWAATSASARHHHLQLRRR